MILQSIFPVTAASTAITNEMIDNANLVICAIAADRGLVFVDANRVLKDEDGYLAAAYCNSADGIHLSEAGYAKILKNLAEYRSAICEET